MVQFCGLKLFNLNVHSFYKDSQGRTQDRVEGGGWATGMVGGLVTNPMCCIHLFDRAKDKLEPIE
jgi:hypothetical protein